MCLCVRVHSPTLTRKTKVGTSTSTVTPNHDDRFSSLRGGCYAARNSQLFIVLASTSPACWN
jgi:hypothetical protein